MKFLDTLKDTEIFPRTFLLKFLAPISDGEHFKIIKKSTAKDTAPSITTAKQNQNRIDVNLDFCQAANEYFWDIDC